MLNWLARHFCRSSQDVTLIFPSTTEVLIFIFFVVSLTTVECPLVVQALKRYCAYFCFKEFFRKPAVNKSKQLLCTLYSLNDTVVIAVFSFMWLLCSLCTYCRLKYYASNSPESNSSNNNVRFWSLWCLCCIYEMKHQTVMKT